MASNAPIKVPHNRLTFGEEEVQAVSTVIRSGYWAGGPVLKTLEDALCKCAGVSHAVGVSSGLSGLRLALQSMDVSEGDEVIVPAYSCVALANAPLALGATPVPADVRTDDWNLDPESVRSCVTKNTKAIIVVNMFGAPGPIEELRDLGIPIIEDCAHAFGADAVGSPLGSRGDAAVLSFYATKLIGAGMGGAVLTNDDAIASTVRSYRGYNDEPMNQLRHNDTMTDSEAALTLCQLDRLQQMIEARKNIATRYDQAFKSLAEESGKFSLPSITADRIWYRYCVEMNSAKGEEVITALRQHGIHAERPVEDWREGDAQKLENASHAYEKLVSLPCYPTLTEEEQTLVCEAFKEVI